MDADWVFALGGIGWVCWTVGGAGLKWVRRFVWPIVVAVIAGLYGISFLTCLITAISLMIVLSLGYSPLKKPLIVRVGIGLSYGLAIMPVTQSILSSLITCTVFITTMQLSLKYDWFHWKIAEGFNGMAQGILIAWGLLV